jgi:hypothetical protein
MDNTWAMAIVQTWQASKHTADHQMVMHAHVHAATHKNTGLTCLTNSQETLLEMLNPTKL